MYVSGESGFLSRRDDKFCVSTVEPSYWLLCSREHFYGSISKPSICIAIDKLGIAGYDMVLTTECKKCNQKSIKHVFSKGKDDRRGVSCKQKRTYI